MMSSENTPFLGDSKYRNSKSGTWTFKVFLTIFLLAFTIFNYIEFRKIEQTLQKNYDQINSTPDDKVLQEKLQQLTVKIDQIASSKPVQDPLPTLELKNMRKLSLSTASEDQKTLLEAGKKEDHKDFYKKVKVEAYCKEKQRIGGAGDGGKYVCNPGAVREDCTLLSLGLSNQITYDEQIMKVTDNKCTILGADSGVQNPDTQEKYSKINGKLFVGMIPTQLTIPSMLEKSGRSDVELLKIDIEGGETTGLEPLLKEYYVCQIFIELHGAPKVHLEMLQMMARYGFRIFNVDPNPFCVQCCEYSLINELCMAQFGVHPLAVTIPQV